MLSIMSRLYSRVFPYISSHHPVAHNGAVIDRNVVQTQKKCTQRYAHEFLVIIQRVQMK